MRRSPTTCCSSCSRAACRALAAACWSAPPLRAFADLFPDSVVRLRWQVLMSSAFGIANAVGPSLGGFLTQYYGWRSVFYVNLPVGLLSLFFVWRFLPHLRHVEHEGKMRLDWPGALLIAVALGSLQLFVEMLPKHGCHVERLRAARLERRLGVRVVAVGKALSDGDFARRDVSQSQSGRALHARRAGRLHDVFVAVLCAVAVPGRLRDVAERSGARHYAARRVHHDRQYRQRTYRLACEAIRI